MIQADHVGAFLESAPQEDQARFEIVLELRQLQAWIEPDFPVRELLPALLEVQLQQLVKDPPGHTFNQIGIIDEHAVIGWKIAHRDAGAVGCYTRCAFRSGRAPPRGRGACVHAAGAGTPPPTTEPARWRPRSCRCDSPRARKRPAASLWRHSTPSTSPRLKRNR